MDASSSNDNPARAVTASPSSAPRRCVMALILLALVVGAVIPWSPPETFNALDYMVSSDNDREADRQGQSRLRRQAWTRVPAPWRILENPPETPEERAALQAFALAHPDKPYLLWAWLAFATRGGPTGLAPGHIRDQHYTYPPYDPRKYPYGMPGMAPLMPGFVPDGGEGEAAAAEPVGEGYYSPFGQTREEAEAYSRQREAEAREGRAVLRAHLALLREREPDNGLPLALEAAVEAGEAVAKVSLTYRNDDGTYGRDEEYRVIVDADGAARAARRLHEAVRKPRFTQHLYEHHRDVLALTGEAETLTDTLVQLMYFSDWELDGGVALSLRDLARRLVAEAERRAGAVAEAPEDIRRFFVDWPEPAPAPAPEDDLTAWDILHDLQTLGARLMIDGGYEYRPLIGAAIVEIATDHGARILRAADREEEAERLLARGRRLAWPDLVYQWEKRLYPGRWGRSSSPISLVADTPAAKAEAERRATERATSDRNHEALSQVNKTGMLLGLYGDSGGLSRLPATDWPEAGHYKPFVMVENFAVWKNLHYYLAKFLWLGFIFSCLEYLHRRRRWLRQPGGAAQIEQAGWPRAWRVAAVATGLWVLAWLLPALTLMAMFGDRSVFAGPPLDPLYVMNSLLVWLLATLVAALWMLRVTWRRFPDAAFLAVDAKDGKGETAASAPDRRWFRRPMGWQEKVASYGPLAVLLAGGLAAAACWWIEWDARTWTYAVLSGVVILAGYCWFPLLCRLSSRFNALAVVPASAAVMRLYLLALAGGLVLFTLSYYVYDGRERAWAARDTLVIPRRDAEIPASPARDAVVLRYFRDHALAVLHEDDENGGAP